MQGHMQPLCILPPVYFAGLMPSRVGWMCLNAFKPPELILANFFGQKFCWGEEEDLGYLSRICWTLVCRGISRSSSSGRLPCCGRFREMASAALVLTVPCSAFLCCCARVFFILFTLERWELQPWTGAYGHIIRCVYSHITAPIVTPTTLTCTQGLVCSWCVTHQPGERCSEAPGEISLYFSQHSTASQADRESPSVCVFIALLFPVDPKVLP